MLFITNRFTIHFLNTKTNEVSDKKVEKFENHWLKHLNLHASVLSRKSLTNIELAAAAHRSLPQELSDRLAHLSLKLEFKLESS